MFYPQQLDIRYKIIMVHRYYVCETLGHRIVYSLPQPINLSFQEMPVPTELPSPTSPAEDEAIFFRKFLMVHGIRWPEKSRSGYIYMYIYKVWDLFRYLTCWDLFIKAVTWRYFSKYMSFFQLRTLNETCSVFLVKSCFRECIFDMSF